MQRVAAKVLNICRRTNVAVPAGGVTTATVYLQRRVAVQGFTKLIGTLRCSGGTPAAGYPRVVQYQDEASSAGPSLITPLPQDGNQPNTSYPINVDISLPYVGIEYQEDAAGAGCTVTVAQCEARGAN